MNRNFPTCDEGNIGRGSHSGRSVKRLGGAEEHEDNNVTKTMSCLMRLWPVFVEAMWDVKLKRKSGLKSQQLKSIKVLKYMEDYAYLKFKLLQIYRPMREMFSMK